VLTNVGCVVVHHRNYPGVLNTIEAIIAGGVPARQLVLVDNSEDSDLTTVLTAQLPIGVALLTQSNSGYGSAVNAGVAALITRTPRPEMILVSTHEVIPEEDAITALVQALCSSGADVVGPTLIDSASSDARVWSTGGELSRILNMPFHTRIGYNPGCEAPKWVKRAWLDGAFCLYRTDVLTRFRFRERYFLYFEEVDLHIRIQKAGGCVVWAPSARVSQVSSGIPPYYLTRNMIIFQAWNGNLAQQVTSPIYSMLRFTVRSWIRQGRVQGIRDAWQGLVDGSRSVKRRTAPRRIGQDIWIRGERR
jgi:N-acetylglucosaminyl-diphospho-decaprenol L-rhamnosyltransferase